MPSYDYTIFDAAVPPDARPAGTQGVLGYVGGRATHVWRPAEWLPFRVVRQFPAWVADLSADPRHQADAAVAAVKALGWAAYEPEPERRAIIYDMETAADPAFYAVLASVTDLAGFVAVAYGSLSTVLQCAAADVLAAEWDDKAKIPAGQTIHGKQYKANVPLGGTEVDYSIIDAWLYQRGGQGARHQPK